MLKGDADTEEADVSMLKPWEIRNPISIVCVESEIFCVELNSWIARM